MLRVKCGWCSEEFDIKVIKGEYGYGQSKCPHCLRIVSSSRKESIGEVIGRKHIHKDLKSGDIV